MADIGTMRNNITEDCGLILAGYLSRAELCKPEYDVMYFMVVGRLVQLVVLGYYQQHKLTEQNDYTMETTSHGELYFNEFFKYFGREDDLVNSWRDIEFKFER